jgi:hypothetical protein
MQTEGDVKPFYVSGIWIVFSERVNACKRACKVSLPFPFGLNFWLSHRFRVQMVCLWRQSAIQERRCFHPMGDVMDT